MEMWAYPLLVPAQDEKIEDFLSRFIADGSMASAIPDPNQRIAVAYVQYGREYLTYKNAKPNKNIIRNKMLLTRMSVDEEPEGMNPVEIELAEGDAAPVEEIQQTVENEDDEEIQQTVESTEPVSGPRKLFGYASVHNCQDLEHDVIFPGAWQKTLKERVKAGKVPLMTKHLATGGVTVDVIGWMSPDSYEDNVGLYSVFDMLDTEDAIKNYQTAKESLKLMRPMGLSVEFYPVEGKYEPNQFGGFNFYELKLLQVTLTPTPCNEAAGVYGAKTILKRDCSGERMKLQMLLNKAFLRTV